MPRPHTGLIIAVNTAGQSMTCPLCLTEFIVPEGGLPALPRNVYIETILSIQRRARQLRTAAAASTGGLPASVESGRRSCTSVVQPSRDRGDDWPTPSAAERGDVGLSRISSNSTGTSFPLTSSRTCWRRRQLHRNKLATSYEDVGDVARPSGHVEMV